MTTKSSTPVTALDFDTVKAALKTYLSGQDKFSDYDFDGSNMSVLLDVLAYNTYINNFYTNMAVSEMFLDSAQLRNSVMSHAKELNYLPASIKSSEATITLTFTANDSPSFITIPKHTVFRTTLNGKAYDFVNLTSATCLPASNGAYIHAGLTVTEGKVITENTLVDGTSTQRFSISNKAADISTIAIAVRESANSSSVTTDYIKKSSLFGVASADKVFYVQPYDEDRYEITFGNDVFGYQPVSGNVIELTYLVSKGANTNGISTVSPVTTIGGYTATAAVTANSAGGTTRETEESIRFYAPKSIQVQERAVTATDFEILLKNNFPEIESVSVYGGETKSPPQYGKVYVAVDVKNADGVSQNNKNSYRTFLEERCSLTIDPVIESPGFIYVEIVSDVTYNTSKSALGASDIRSLVNTAITSYSSTNLNSFKKTLRYSRLINDIDEAETNIISNFTEVRGIIKMTPILAANNSYDISYEQKLVLEHTLVSGDTLDDFEPAITSTSFTYDGSSGYMIDDGAGALHIIAASGSSFVYLKKNIGTVDYETGTVIIQNLNVSAYEGSAIKLYARTRTRDIVAPQGRIIQVADADVTITVTGTEE